MSNLQKATEALELKNNPLKTYRIELEVTRKIGIKIQATSPEDAELKARRHHENEGYTQNLTPEMIASVEVTEE